MKRRRLTEDDIELWRRVTSHTEKLGLDTLYRPKVDILAATPNAPKRSKEVILGTRSSKTLTVAQDLAPSLPLNQAPVQMDQKVFSKLKRGRIKPEGRIDLHGMTLDRAHPALSRFILTSHQNGKRLVLVITGKGKVRDDGGPIPVRQGVLRHQVPQWLGLAPLSSVVLQVVQAHVRHGGGGAYYVYLRRDR